MYTDFLNRLLVSTDLKNRCTFIKRLIPVLSTTQAVHKLLIISHDIVGKHMAGPGIRYYHLARVLAAHVQTTLAIPHESPQELPAHNFHVVRYTRHDWASIEPHIRAADICLFPSDTANEFPLLAQSEAYLIVDGYDPLLAEWLALGERFDAAAQQLAWRYRMGELNRQYLIGDFYICASERQRDWWLGLLEAHGRINPVTFNADPSLRTLIDVAPYGLTLNKPDPAHRLIKGVWPGIGLDDKVILWGGGLWPWLDPLTAIRAIAQICGARPELKLIFPGTKHPNPMMAGMPTQNAAAFALAEALGVRDQHVFFGDWVAYTDWPAVLAESDVALTLHYDTLETRLAFRSRVLEYIAAGVPIVATRGDATSELVASYQLGAIVDYGDVAGVADAILQCLDQPQTEHWIHVEDARQQLTWERAAAPLISFCQRPQRAVDKQGLTSKLGNPAYVDTIERLQTLVDGYEQGRFMRLMRGWHRFRQKISKRI